MAKIQLSPSVVTSAVCPTGKKRLDLFDTQTKGLLLEIRVTGGKTYYLRYQNKRGKTRQLKLADAKDVSLSQARTLATKARSKIAMGEDPAEEHLIHKQVPTFGELVKDSYLPFIRAYKRSWRVDDGLLRNHLLPRFGAKHVDEISRQDIIKMMNDRKSAGSAPATVNHLLIILRYIYNLAIKWKTPGVTTNPTKDVMLLKVNNKKERYIDVDEAKRLYASVCRSRNTMLRYIVPMLILTGARKNEVLHSKWQDFDLQRRTWRIPVTKAGKVRHVPLSDGAVSVLASIPRLDGCDYAFANPKTRKPFISIFYAWKTAREDAGLSEVRMHDLRHSFASLLVNSGRSLYEVQHLLGHAQAKTTQRYAHLSQETLLDAANAATTAVGAVMLPPVVIAPVPASQAALRA